MPAGKFPPEGASALAVAREPRSVPFAEAFRFWIKLGFISFGGPAGQIAIMHRELVERRRWISEERFLHALNYCMLLPGPEAQQLATYIGWLLHRVWGGLIAGAFFVIPSIFILLGLSYAYAAYGNLPVVAGLLTGFKPVVVAIVVEAVFRIGRRALRHRAHLIIAAGAFIAIYVFHVSFPLIVVTAGLAGFLGAKLGPNAFTAGMPKAEDASQEMSAEGNPAELSLVIDDHSPPPPHTLPSRARLVRTLAVGLLLWTLPLLLLAAWRGSDSVHTAEYLFFTKAALVTFGGAYAVLAYVAQAAAGSYGWLTHAQAVDGLALAETTPGPLIMVLQFVGYLAAWRHPEGLTPAFSALTGALVATYATFLPCFLFIFAGAPYIEVLRGNKKLSGALAGVTASVVGVILNLALVFGAAVIWPAGFAGGTDWFAVTLGLLAFYTLFRFKADVLWVVIAGGLAGLARVFLVG